MLSHFSFLLSPSFFFSLSCFGVAQGGGGGAIPIREKNVPFVKYLEL